RRSRLGRHLPRQTAPPEPQRCPTRRTVTEGDYSPNLGRRLKGRGKLLARRAFELGQHFGVDVLPRHFYSQIPDIRELRATEHWRRPRSLVGIAGSALEGQ